MTSDQLLGRDRPGSPVWAHVLGLVGAAVYLPYVGSVAYGLIRDRFF